MIKEFLRDEAPKAPILLYALENSNPFAVSESNTSIKYKHDLCELNQSLWLAELSRQADMVIPFNQDAMAQLSGEMIQQYKGKEFLFHRSAL